MGSGTGLNDHTTKIRINSSSRGENYETVKKNINSGLNSNE